MVSIIDNSGYTCTTFAEVVGNKNNPICRGGTGTTLHIYAIPPLAPSLMDGSETFLKTCLDDIEKMVKWYMYHSCDSNISRRIAQWFLIVKKDTIFIPFYPLKTPKKGNKRRLNCKISFQFIISCILLST